MIRGAVRRTKDRMEGGRKMPAVAVTEEVISGLPTTCALSGVELVFCAGHVNLASLDRIDDNGGYTDRNVQLVDIRFNTRAKWTSNKYRDALGWLEGFRRNSWKVYAIARDTDPWIRPESETA